MVATAVLLRALTLHSKEASNFNFSLTSTSIEVYSQIVVKSSLVSSPITSLIPLDLAIVLEVISVTMVSFN
jgi:hypothetical protein